jgi:hypothetical protein
MILYQSMLYFSVAILLSISLRIRQVKQLARQARLDERQEDLDIGLRAGQDTNVLFQLCGHGLSRSGKTLLLPEKETEDALNDPD